MQQDYTEKYNTTLSKKEQAEFDAFIKQEAEKTGRDYSKDMFDYDVKGWWKSGAATSENNHGPDTFKKPNHPTFSDESQYHGKDKFSGGKWGGTDDAPTYTPSETNLKQYGKDELLKYFQEREPDVKLILPKSKAERRYGGR